jgi:hypothetical protein
MELPAALPIYFLKLKQATRTFIATLGQRNSNGPSKVINSTRFLSAVAMATQAAPMSAPAYVPQFPEPGWFGISCLE